MSANRGVEEACQAERRSPHTIRELGESSLEVAAPKGSSRWLALDPEQCIRLEGPNLLGGSRMADSVSEEL